MADSETPDYVQLTQPDIERLFKAVPRQVVIPAPEGRFLLQIPKFDDGLGPIRIPNVKDLLIRLTGGTQGSVDLLRCESEPQAIKTDGTQVIVINKIDKHIGIALTSKLEELQKRDGGLTRAAISEFLTYASGYHYDPETGKAKLAAARIGFNPDIYHQSIGSAQKLHYDPNARFADLHEQAMLPPGRYIKKPVPTTAVYIDSPIAYKNQTFAHGVILQMSMAENGKRSISFIDPTDIDQCYTWIDGTSLLNDESRVQLPHYTINHQHEIAAMGTTHIFTPDDVRTLETIGVNTQSSRVYIKPDKRFFGDAEKVNFWNEADQVTQSLDMQDGVIICAFNYRKKNDDYEQKAKRFHDGVQAAHAEATSFDDLIARVSSLYRTLDIGTPDIYTSTREKMKLQGLEGVNNEVVVKEGKAELLRIIAPEDELRFHRNSEHRDADQVYASEMFVQVTDRGTKYEKMRGIQSQFAASAYEMPDGTAMELRNIPTYSAEYVKGPQGVAQGTAEAVSVGVPAKQVG